MPATPITPAIVASYGLGTVSQADIDDGAVAIETETGFTVDEHVDTRQIPDTSVSRAWSIVASRIRDATVQAATGAPISETQGDYGYTLPSGDIATGTALYPNLLAGIPNVMLRLGISSLRRADHDLPATSGDRPGWLPPMYDDYGVKFPRN